MSDTKLLQAIFNKVSNLEKQAGDNHKTLTSRLDKIGSQLAYLEDDTPTTEDHNKLKRRVRKLEIKVDSLAKN